ncbi:MAG TPA: diacylglycerol kinase family protein [Paracoccaceae bacterium]|nr:diacylglycerol kinase family protein [Paracoccaceae bacterium]
MAGRELIRLGLLRNPASTGNLGRPPPALPDGVELAETAGPQDCEGALARLAEGRPDLLIIDGGDGTVRDAISRFPAIFGADWPAVAVIASGNTNLIARRLGAVTPGDLPRLAAMSPADLSAWLRPAPVLRIDIRGETRRGFIAGWGAYATATRIGREEIAARHGAQVARAVMATLHRALVGAEAAALRRGVEAAFRADGHADAKGRRFLGIATTLPGRLMGPLSPFWGDGRGPVRWLDVLAPPRRLALAAPLVALGRPTAAMRRSGYRSGRSARLELELASGAGGIVLDGEEIPGGGGISATITGHETVRWTDLRRTAISTSGMTGGNEPA